MAIYKLKEISIIKNGKTPSTKKTIYWKKEIPFFGPGEFNQTPKRFITEMKGWTKPKNTILISTTATIGNITILNQRSWFNQQITSILVNKYHSSQYVYYYLLRKKHIFKKMSDGGTVFPIIHINSIRNLEINIPSLKEQQKIIDIIEPINYLKNNIKSIENKIKFLVKNQSFKSFNKMYEFVKFNKGSIVKSTEFIYKNDQSNLIPFIDIKSLTGIVNKYLDNRKYKSNTQIGDVLLSLDGAPGRVSITNNGYNGYAYKINSNTISNAIIWASLINKINQKIIQKHSYGTTILHANKSKELLLILNFKNVELIKILYQIKLLIFKIQQLIKDIYNLMLQLLIK